MLQFISVRCHGLFAHLLRVPRFLIAPGETATRVAPPTWPHAAGGYPSRAAMAAAPGAAARSEAQCQGAAWTCCEARLEREKEVLALVRRAQGRVGKATVACPIAHFSPRWFSAEISQSTRCTLSFSYLLTMVPEQVMVSPGRAMAR